MPSSADSWRRHLDSVRSRLHRHRRPGSRTDRSAPPLSALAVLAHAHSLEEASVPRHPRPSTLLRRSPRSPPTTTTPCGSSCPRRRPGDQRWQHCPALRPHGRAAPLPAYVTSPCGKAVGHDTGLSIRGWLAHVYGPATGTSHLVHPHSLTNGRIDQRRQHLRRECAQRASRAVPGVHPRVTPVQRRLLRRLRIGDLCPPGTMHSQVEDGIALMTLKFFEHLVMMYRNDGTVAAAAELASSPST
jgi:hypothetical protein